MDQVQVEITSLAITQRYGTLTSGTILKTDAEYAKHLVEDAMAAKYVKPHEPNATTAVPSPATETKPAAGVVTNPAATQAKASAPAVPAKTAPPASK